MKLPPGKTEEEVIQAINNVVRILAPKFTFGYYDVDDIKQHAFMEALRVLEKESYDPSRPLENFMYTHLRNRLINLKRKKLRRNDPPCKKCHTGEYCGDVREYCKKYSVWRKRNDSKANLIQPLGIDNISDEHETRTRLPSSVVFDAEVQECIRRVDEALSPELRILWKQMLDGVRLPKSKRQQVENAVKIILGDTLCQKRES